jgi:uncharacterized protein with PQ loop repeat
MENNEKIMTGEESLRIITEMINKTKVNIRQSSFHLLFWGWLIVACSLSEYLLFKLTDYATPWYVWFLVIPGVFVSMIYGFVTGRKEKVYTYATMLYIWTWIGFLFAAIVLFIILSNNLQAVGPFILLLAGFPTFMSGLIIKFRPLIFGGITFWILTPVAQFAGPDIALLTMPVAIIIGYLIPGYMLKRKTGHEKV